MCSKFEHTLLLRPCEVHCSVCLSHTVNYLTLSPLSPLRLYTLPYWSNAPHNVRTTHGTASRSRCEKFMSRGNTIKTILTDEMRCKKGHFSLIPVFLPIVYVLHRIDSFVWVENGKCSVVIPSHSHQASKPFLCSLPFPQKWSSTSHSYGIPMGPVGIPDIYSSLLFIRKCSSVH